MSHKKKTTTKEKTTPKPVPKLRFPEFRDAGGWEETPLKDCLTEHKLKSDGSCEVHSVSVHKGVINQKEHLGRSFAAADTSGYNMARPYDVIYTKSPTGDFPFGIVKQNKLPYNVIVSPLYGVFKPTNQYLGYIFDAYFESPIRANNYLAPITQKGAKNTIQITNETFISKGLYLPMNEREQQKIADCLSSLDELITLQARKVDVLKTHKKGLMQQLFPREGETQPRLRFPEFQDAEEWAVKKLQEIAPLQRGFDLASDEIRHGNVPIIYSNGPKGFHERGMAKGPGIVTGRSGTIGKVHFIEQGDYWPHNTSLWVTSFEGHFPKFVFYLFELIGFLRFASGSGVPTLNRNDAHAFVTSVPPSTDEQQRIADCLSSLDDLIAAQIQKLEALKMHKKGLMQQLFPSPKEAEI